MKISLVLHMLLVAIIITFTGCSKQTRFNNKVDVAENQIKNQKLYVKYLYKKYDAQLTYMNNNDQDKKLAAAEVIQSIYKKNEAAKRSHGFWYRFFIGLAYYNYPLINFSNELTSDINSLKSSIKKLSKLLIVEPSLLDAIKKLSQMLTKLNELIVVNKQYRQESQFKNQISNQNINTSLLMLNQSLNA